MSGKLEINVNEFLNSLKTLIDPKIRQAAERGVGQAATQLLRDAVLVEPAVPLDEGFLRGSGSAHVNGAQVSTTSGIAGAKGGSPLETFTEGASTQNIITGAVVFNTPYASYQHEGMRLDGSHVVKVYSNPGAGSGAKFLESKLLTRRDLYIKIIANRIAEATK